MRGLSINQCFQEITLTVGDGCPSRTNIFKRYQELQIKNFNLENLGGKEGNECPQKRKLF